MATRIPRDVLRLLNSVTSKRPRTVIDHIIKHGHITTEELKNQYCYNHPPRAARDVREQGIPLETFNVKDSTGRSIGAYRFAKWKDFRVDTLKGRTVLPKRLKKDLVQQHGSKCLVCSATYEERYLQIDHRVPYQIAGDDAPQKRDISDYMLLCSSCNRAKSWSCEHCANWQSAHDEGTCKECYWASPLDYSHVALCDVRRLAMVWQADEISQYDGIKSIAEKTGTDLPEFVKEVLRRTLEE